MKWRKMAGSMLLMLCMSMQMSALTVHAAQAVPDYEVAKGDCLTRISKEVYGTENYWKQIYNLNQEQIGKDYTILVGDVLKVAAPLEAINQNSMVNASTCTELELVRYLFSNADEETAKAFIETGIWPEGIAVPKNSDVLLSDGQIDWNQAPSGGYTLDEEGKAVKLAIIPQIGEVIDRYGSESGRYTCPVPAKGAYNFEQRSMPYVEDPSSYHQYKIIGDFSRLEEYVAACTDQDTIDYVNNSVEKYYDGDFSRLTVFKGDIAPAFGSAGMGVQYEFPLGMSVLCKLGILEKIK